MKHWATDSLFLAAMTAGGLMAGGLLGCVLVYAVQWLGGERP